MLNALCDVDLRSGIIEQFVGADMICGFFCSLFIKDGLAFSKLLNHIYYGQIRLSIGSVV